MRQCLAVWSGRCRIGCDLRAARICASTPASLYHLPRRGRRRPSGRVGPKAVMCLNVSAMAVHKVVFFRLSGRKLGHNGVCSRVRDNSAFATRLSTPTTPLCPFSRSNSAPHDGVPLGVQAVALVHVFDMPAVRFRSRRQCSLRAHLFHSWALYHSVEHWPS